MKTFFCIRLNQYNKSGISSKIWKIERSSPRIVRAYWGSCIFDKKRRKPIPSKKLGSKKWSFHSEKDAIIFEQKRIQEKKRQGYERSPKWRQM